ncbi:MAG: cytochrome c [Casimicrobiaceae bacterium]
MSAAHAAKKTGVCRAGVAIVTGLLWLSSNAVVAADAVAGRAKAQACAVCHGPLGLSTQPDAPNLAGQPAVFLSSQLRAYRSGERRHEVMNIMAKPLSDDDIDNLAAWFSSVRIDAHAPP